jgi:hypothetical protein
VKYKQEVNSSKLGQPVSNGQLEESVMDLPIIDGNLLSTNSRRGGMVRPALNVSTDNSHSLD